MATIFRCVTDAGAVTYTDQPCKRETPAIQEAVEPAPAFTEQIAVVVPHGAEGVAVVLLAYVVMSTLGLLAYGLDKRRAVRGQWRLSEGSLHTIDLLGGWPGGLLGQRMFRHKTRKRSFQLVFRLTVALHVACWVDYLFLGLSERLFREHLGELFGKVGVIL